MGTTNVRGRKDELNCLNLVSRSRADEASRWGEQMRRADGASRWGEQMRRADEASNSEQITSK